MSLSVLSASGMTEKWFLLLLETSAFFLINSSLFLNKTQFFFLFWVFPNEVGCRGALSPSVLTQWPQETDLSSSLGTVMGLEISCLAPFGVGKVFHRGLAREGVPHWLPLLKRAVTRWGRETVEKTQVSVFCQVSNCWGEGYCSEKTALDLRVGLCRKRVLLCIPFFAPCLRIVGVHHCSFMYIYLLAEASGI